MAFHPMQNIIKKIYYSHCNCQINQNHRRVQYIYTMCTNFDWLTFTITWLLIAFIICCIWKFWKIYTMSLWVFLNPLATDELQALCFQMNIWFIILFRLLICYPLSLCSYKEHNFFASKRKEMNIQATTNPALLVTFPLWKRLCHCTRCICTLKL